VATLASIVDRVRMEIGDSGKSFVWQVSATGTDRYEMPYSPVDAVTLAVFVDGVDVSDDVDAEEHTGVITFDTAPAIGDSISVQGTYYRFFTNAELALIVDGAVKEHLYNRTDSFGRALTVANMPTVEEFPTALLGAIQALYTLATDAAFDISISTPDGVSIPRSERFRQLMDIINERKVQYDDLCKALNIGLTRIEVFTLRRISKSTNRYIPIYMPQEVDDRTPPQRVFIPIPTYGGAPVPDAASQFDLVFTQGDDFSVTQTLPIDLTGCEVKAQMRLYPESAAIIAEIAVAYTNRASGLVTLSVTSDQTTRVPLRCFWDLQVTGPAPESLIETYTRGQVFCKRQITR
jgi:hypothetical protein